jgi:hypothetical protein
MKRSSFVSAGLAAFAGVSLGLKSIYAREATYPESFHPLYATWLAATLRDEGFTVQTTPNSTVVAAARATCQLWAQPIRPEGGDDTNFRERFATSGRTLAYTFGGAASADRPDARGVFDGYVARFLFPLTGGRPPDPTFAVAYEGECGGSVIGQIAKIAARSGG